MYYHVNEVRQTPELGKNGGVIVRPSASVRPKVISFGHVSVIPHQKEGRQEEAFLFKISPRKRMTIHNKDIDCRDRLG